MNTIVALVEFSDATSPVLQQGQKLARAFDSQLVIVHVVPKEPVVIDIGLISPTLMKSPAEEAIQADHAKLLLLRDSLIEAGVKATVDQLREGTVETVMHECDRLSADLIIVGSHSHSTLYNWFVGTFTNDVLKSARCPVLVVPRL